ncbi:MAG: cytochrome c3 family protein [Planctomycetota bacterium]|jgi:hypothetical protein
MAKRQRSSKEIADRIDPTYFRRVHALRRLRFWSSVGFCVLAVGWVALAWARGDEMIYSNGDVAAAHAIFEADCARCHVGEFRAVEDASCRACHSMAAHAPDEKVVEPACARCHRDHRGRGGLAVVGDVHCNGCHESHRAYVDMDSHLDFEVEPRDQYLRFDHQAHLDPKLLEGPLECASCHEPEEEGFRALSFDHHCAKCHTELLDEDLPGVKAPHGLQPDALRDWITAAYLRGMRRDGSLAAKEGLGTSETPDWAETLARKADAATRALLEPNRKRGCLFCHTMADGRIRAPEVPASWLTKARFDHRPHESQACAACHEIATSRAASDLRLPGIADCRDCHKPHGASDRCVTCHRYH